MGGLACLQYREAHGIQYREALWVSVQPYWEALISGSTVLRGGLVTQQWEALWVYGGSGRLVGLEG